MSEPTARRLLPVAGARDSARLAGRLLRRRRLVMAACAAAFVVEALAGLVGPLMLGRIVDVVQEPGASGADLVTPVVAIAVAGLVLVVATTAAVALLARATEPALADLREQVLDRALYLDVQQVEDAGSGDLLSRVGDDVRLLTQSLSTVAPLITTSVLAIVFTAAGLFTLDWRLGLAGLAVLPFYVSSLRWYLPRSGPYYQRERAANGARAEAFLTGVHARRTLRALGLSQAHQATVDAASWRSARLTIDVFHLLTRFFARNNRNELYGLLLVIVTGFVLVRADSTSVGDVTAAALLFHRLFNPIGAVMTLFDEVQSAGASLTRLCGLALLPEREPANPSPSTGGPRASAGELVVEGVGHAYRAGEPVLADVDLVVAPGERVAVVGASGAGKSTLAVVIAGLVEPSTGAVRVGGRPVRPRAARHDVVLVTQETHVFSGTVRDNLTLTRAEADTAQLEAALETVGARGWVEALDDGLDTVVGDAATALTAAQAQQLALARVVLADPLVVVLDEATAEAGSAGARALEVAALAVTHGRTTLTVAHRLTQARAADRVVVMDAGRVAEVGTHDELVAAGGRYALLWRAWSGEQVATVSTPRR